jgi:hypothetical protein
MRWRYWLVEFPATCVSVWSTFYWTVMSLLGFAMLLMVMASLVLYQFGIRWGW